MAKDCVFKVEASALDRASLREISVATGPQILLRGYMTDCEWQAFRSGLMPNSRVDFIIEEEEDGTTERG